MPMFRGTQHRRNRDRFARLLALESLEGRKLLSTTTVELPNGTVDVSTFDSNGHLTGFTSTDSAGTLQLSQTNRYNAAGTEIGSETDYGPSFGPMAGASITETFSAATGRMNSFTETHADGSMETATFNSAGTETSSTAFDAAGNLKSQQIYTYSPTGSLASVTDTAADGSSTRETFYADENVASIARTATDGTTSTTSYRDISTGTWNDLIEG